MKPIRTMLYKGHALSKVVDDFGQEFVIIDGEQSRFYASFNDARRAINGLSIWYEILDY